MSIIYILIPIAIILTSIAVYLFFWAVKTEQFEDLEKQGMSILFDDNDNNNTENSVKNDNNNKNKDKKNLDVK
ncbi:MAG: cbb3-type cytochrome oxidase assembly protein CcoS [Alteromonadaceae bacterium]